MTHGAILLATVIVAAAACADESRTPPEPPTGLAVEFDGLRIWDHEVEPFRRYVEAIDNRAGHLTLLGGILDGFLIPLKMAQRAWHEERETQRERAEGFARAVGNEGYPGLVQKGRSLAGEPTTDRITRNDLPLPLAVWAFDKEKIGQVSPVIETPQGFAIVSTYKIVDGRTSNADTAEVYQVSFYTHGAKDFSDWYFAERVKLAGKVTHVGDDYRRALPPWIRQ